MVARCASALIVILSLAPTPARDRLQITEPRTGIAFPAALVPPGGDATHHLVGTGVRTRTWFRIKVYAVGLYVDAGAARRALSSFAGEPVARLERDRRLFESLLEMAFGMTLRLVMARDVSGRDVVNSFNDALTPRLDQAAARSVPGADTALDDFRRSFQLDDVAKGTEILFSCGPAGRFETSVNGSARPAIESPALCWALFDVYLGEHPISGSVKGSLISGLPDLLAGGPPDSLSRPRRQSAPFHALLTTR